MNPSKKSPGKSASSPVIKNAVGPKSTSLTIPVENKKTRSRSPQAGTSSTNNSPKAITNAPTSNKNSAKRKCADSISNPELQPKKRRSTFEKVTTPNLKTPEVEDTPLEKRRSIRIGSNGSPGVKEMLGAMQSDMNDREIRESLVIQPILFLRRANDKHRKKELEKKRKEDKKQKRIDTKKQKASKKGKKVVVKAPKPVEDEEEDDGNIRRSGRLRIKKELKKFVSESSESSSSEDETEESSSEKDKEEVEEEEEEEVEPEPERQTNQKGSKKTPAKKTPSKKGPAKKTLAKKQEYTTPSRTPRQSARQKSKTPPKTPNKVNVEETPQIDDGVRRSERIRKRSTFLTPSRRNYRSLFCKMDDQSHNLSLHLYEILDCIGASEEIRGKWREKSIIYEILVTMMNNIAQSKTQGTVYGLGSRFEGTLTDGMDSDTDTLICSRYPIVERIFDAPQDGKAFLMVTDETTKPGYVKLQYVRNQCPMFSQATSEQEETDNKGRLCLRHLVKNDGVLRNNCPATTTTFSCEGINVDTDDVYAHRCQHIPSFANSWLRRIISCNQLNDTQIYMLKESGCFLVWKNHPSSQNGPIELRLSFSLQERDLMASLNPTQHKCYILLKIINKDILLKRVPESISSYHCKTCVLYIVENTSCELWIRKNLLKCTLLCIKQLLYWVKKQNCPNYFVQDENMFDKFECSTLRRVQVVLEDIEEHWYTCLCSLTCDDIGKMWHDVLFGFRPSIIGEQNVNVLFKATALYVNINSSLRRLVSRMLEKCKSISALDLMSKLQSTKTYILHTEGDIYHTKKETRQAIRYFIPYLYLQIGQCIASIILTTSDADPLKRTLDTSFKYYIKGSKDLDRISAKLIVASYCLQNDKYDACGENLLECETSLKSPVISFCGCRTTSTVNKAQYSELAARMFVSRDTPYTEFAKTCTTGCLFFLPNLAKLVPSALHYEMYRSVYTPPDSREEYLEYWFDWIVVDSKVYLYFLQYIFYSKTNKSVKKQDALDNLLHVIRTDTNLGHRETAYNLLGWIFKQENKVQQAMECFRRSLRISPIHNAAKWHVLVMIHSLNILNADRHIL